MRYEGCYLHLFGLLPTLGLTKNPYVVLAAVTTVVGSVGEVHMGEVSSYFTGHLRTVHLVTALTICASQDTRVSYGDKADLS